MRAISAKAAGLVVIAVGACVTPRMSDAAVGAGGGWRWRVRPLV